MRQRQHTTRTKPSGRATLTRTSNDVAAPQEPTSIFQTMTTNQDLTAGVYLLRPLGRGKYEFVNINTVEETRLGSEEVGKEINTVPERFALFEATAKDLSKLKSKIIQGYRSAKLDVFRFLKLPIELRFAIYELLLVASTRLPRSPGFRAGGYYACMSVRLACKQTYEESRTFFYRNTFAFTKVPGSAMEHKKFAANIKTVHVTWKNEMKTAIAIFKWIAAFEKLETLELEMHQGRRTHVCKQKLFQEDKTISTFSRLPGFDELISIRGLKDVIFDRGYWHWFRIKPTEAQEQRFAEFLTALLTQPREVKKVAALPKKIEGKRKSTRKSIKVIKIIEATEDEHEGRVSYAPEDDDDSDYHA